MLSATVERYTVEDLIKEIQERTGLSAEKVLEVVTMVTDHMRSVLPEDLVAQIATYLGDAASTPGSAASDAIAAAADLASKAAGTAAAAVSTVLDAVGDMIPAPDDE